MYDQLCEALADCVHLLDWFALAKPKTIAEQSYRICRSYRKEPTNKHLRGHLLCLAQEAVDFLLVHQHISGDREKVETLRIILSEIKETP